MKKISWKELTQIAETLGYLVALPGEFQKITDTHFTFRKDGKIMYEGTVIAEYRTREQMLQIMLALR